MVDGVGVLVAVRVHVRVAVGDRGVLVTVGPCAILVTGRVGVRVGGACGDGVSVGGTAVAVGIFGAASIHATSNHTLARPLAPVNIPRKKIVALSARAANVIVSSGGFIPAVLLKSAGPQITFGDVGSVPPKGSTPTWRPIEGCTSFLVLPGSSRACE